MMEQILDQIAPEFVHQIKELIRESEVGICAGTIKLNDIQSGTYFHVTQPAADRFKIVIPYSGSYVSWEVLFNMDYPEVGPDFLFDDADFMLLVDPEFIEENVPSLAHWDYLNPKSLLQVLRELLACYRNYQAALLEGYQRLSFEYRSLTNELGIDPQLVEVFANNQHSRGISFLIQLQVDFGKIPEYLTNENLGNDKAILLVMFEDVDGNKISPELYLSPRVERALGSGLTIPAFRSGEALLDYIPAVCDILNKRVDVIVSSYRKRQEFIAASLSHLGRCLLEYDAEKYYKISFLLDYKDFYFVLSIRLSDKFPQERPQLEIQSVYHASYGRPYTEDPAAFPYSPRWDCNQMVERLCTYLTDFIPQFQQQSIRSAKS